jgi:hypothetical protein
MDKSVWFSRRALRLHAVILVIVPAFMALCVWQIHRALGGNSLSWAYVFEWPLFACYAVYMWWRLVHESTAEGRHVPGDAGQEGDADSPAGGDDSAGAGAASEREQQEDAELAAYNAYLAQLAERDRSAHQGHGR